MLYSYKSIIPVVCLSLVLAACSSSNGANPDSTGGSSGTSGATDGETESGSTEGMTSGDTEGSSAGTGAGVDGVGTTGGGTEVVGAATIDEIQGEWSTGCLPFQSLYRRHTLSIVGARMRQEFISYSDQECTQPNTSPIGLVLSGTSLQRNVTTVPVGGTRQVTLGDAIEVNYHFEQATLDNRLLEASEISGNDFLLAHIEYDIVLVEGDSLYIGDTSLEEYDALSPQARPIALDFNFFYSRVP